MALKRLSFIILTFAAFAMPSASLVILLSLLSKIVVMHAISFAQCQMSVRLRPSPICLFDYPFIFTTMYFFNIKYRSCRTYKTLRCKTTISAIIHFFLTLPFSSLKDIEKIKIERINP